MSIRQLDETRASKKADDLGSKFKNRIVGQPKAFEALTRVLEKYQSGIYDRSRPIASLLFLGPTGVGKTGSVEAFVEGLFGTAGNMLKVDCAEFQHSHEIAKLIGSPPGYLGHNETHPFFTNKAITSKFTKSSTNPITGVEVNVGTTDPAFTVILFDEIEKANDALWNLLLGVLDRGSLTTGTNEKVDMTPTVIIMTSNVGSAELAIKAGNAGMGFGIQAEQEFDYDTMKNVAMSAARAKFTPEFLNRLDEAVVFRSLTSDDLLPILKIELDKLRHQIILTSRTIFEFEVSPAAIRQIVAEGYDKRYNARNLKRTIEKYVSLPLARMVATGQLLDNDVVIVDYKDKWLYYAKTETKPGIGKTSIPAGQVAMPSLPLNGRASSSPSSVSQPWWAPYYDKSTDDVLEMPLLDSRPETDSGDRKR
jgi:ATP-dependent Clp protease ATP-binding subunit ClpB